MSAKAILRMDWASHKAAAYACQNWHYSKAMPMPPLVRVGVWEDGKFIGVVLFSRGASPKLGNPYGLGVLEVCELTRVALTQHETPVSRIVAVAIRLLRKTNPGLRLIVSFADANRGHHGGIYQAGGWIYAGTTAKKFDYVGPNGKRYQSRQIGPSGVVRQFGKTTQTYRRDQCKQIEMHGKHRYLMPLDAAMRAQIAPLAISYPSRPKGQEPANPAGLGGSTPTRTLQSTEPDSAGVLTPAGVDG